MFDRRAKIEDIAVIAEVWRKEFLTLMGNIKRTNPSDAKTIEDFKKRLANLKDLAKAMGRWSRDVESTLVKLRDELKEMRGRKDIMDWIPGEVDKMLSPVWKVVTGMSGYDVDKAASYDVNAMLEQRKSILKSFEDSNLQPTMDMLDPLDYVLGPYGNWLRLGENLRKWDVNARRLGPPAWKALQEVASLLKRFSVDVKARRDETKLVKLEGIPTVLFNYSPSMDEHLEEMAAGIRIYKERAAKVLPWLLKHQLPLHITLESKGDTAASYEQRYIQVYFWGAASHPREFAKVLAHEMAHHLFHSLSGQARNDWWKTINGDYQVIDLKDVFKRMKPDETMYQFGKRMKREDPVLYLQVESMMHDYRYKGLDIYSFHSLKDYLDKGKPSEFALPMHPISGYASRNPDEAFCDAVGLLVGYGPRTLHPIVRAWLMKFIPDVKIASITSK